MWTRAAVAFGPYEVQKRKEPGLSSWLRILNCLIDSVVDLDASPGSRTDPVSAGGAGT